MKEKMSQWPWDIIWRVLLLRSIFIVVFTIFGVSCVISVIEKRPVYLESTIDGGRNTERTFHPGTSSVNQSYPKESNARIKTDQLSLKRDLSSKVITATPDSLSSNKTQTSDECYTQSNYSSTNSEVDAIMTKLKTTLKVKKHSEFNNVGTQSENKIIPVSKHNGSSSNYYDISNHSNAQLHNKTLSKPRKTLYIGGLFDLTGSRSGGLGRSELTAAQLAIDHVNKEHVIPGYDLQLLYNDTGCDPGVAMDALYDLIYRRQRILMVIGSACSEVTKTLAEIVPYWNLVLVSFASTSPALSEREKYTTFFRLAPADSSQNIPRAHFITHFGWNIVATLYEMEEDYSLAIDDLGRAFEQSNITIKISQSFRRYDDIEDTLIEIEKLDARIIFGSFSEAAARQVLCVAYRLKMYGSRYVWIFMGDYVERWWELGQDTACTTSQLRKAAEGYFTIDSLNSLGDDDLSAANISLRQFLQDYRTYKGPLPMSPYATSTYDTVWTIALTLKQTQEDNSDDAAATETPDLEHFTYSNGTKIKAIVFDHMQNMGFYGISGPISFEGPDRKGISVISQNQHGRMSRIALYEPDKEKLNFFCRTCQSISWIGGRAPRDKKVLVPKQKRIQPFAFLCVSSVSGAGLVLASIFLAYNLYHRQLRYIKLSSPKLNNVAVIGCMLVYSGIIVLGYDDSNFGEKTYPYICTIRVFLFAAGFSLAFGAMFTKTYRVHQIFTRANSGLIKSKLLRDKQLLFIIGALLVVDTVVLLLWVLIDPMQRHTTNLNEEPSENDEDLFFISQLTTCHSDHLDKWTGAMYAYKGLLLVFGVYMAWETRNVKIPALNDSKYIGMNVYNVVIMSIIVVTISNILSHQPTLAYVMESSFMLFSTTTTLCLLFVPKIYAIVTYSGEPVITASGITVDGANCRRFAVDERRDLFYRAEVQNRVYKRELVELDQEILRLEGLLELPIQPYPRLTNELLYLLQESRVDPTPTMKRRKAQAESCISISDAGDVCMGISDEKSDDELDAISKSQSVLTVPESSPKPFRRRANRLSIRVATSFAVSKLCKLRSRSRYSVGSLKPDCGVMTPSTSTPDISPFTNTLLHGRLSHPLLRQEAIEEKRIPGLTVKQSSEKSDTVTYESHLSDYENDTESDNAQKQDAVSIHLKDNKNYLQVPFSCNMFGCDDRNDTLCYVQSIKRKRKYGNTLDVPMSSDECKISSVDVCDSDNTSPRVRRARSIIEHERRTRIRKLQAALVKIQKELQDLDELEYEVSIV